MSAKILKRALLSNAGFSTISGLTFLLMSRSVAELIGLGAPLLYQIIGAGLLGFAGYVAWIGTRNPINTYEALQVSLADFLWVLGTVVVIGFAFASLNTWGMIAMLLVATVVLSFGLLQLKGIQEVYAVPNKPDTHRICVAVNSRESADKMWPIVADMANIKAYSPHLASVILRDSVEPGVNAVRQCTDDKGKTWAEECTLYDHDKRKLDVTFLADEPGFPYPFKTMIGGWEVESNGAESTVNIWFEVTPKNRWLQPFILGVMSKDLAINFGDVVARMAADARGEVIPHNGTVSKEGITYTLVPCI